MAMPANEKITSLCFWTVRLRLKPLDIMAS